MDNVPRHDSGRSQLAMLLYVAISHLRANPDKHPARVLFDLLPKLATFDVAFVVEDRGSGEQEAVIPWFLLHPDSAPFPESDCKIAIAEASRASTIDDISRLNLQTPQHKLRGRAIVPVGRGDFLVLLSRDPEAYCQQGDFLSLLGEVYSAALARSRAYAHSHAAPIDQRKATIA